MSCGIATTLIAPPPRLRCSRRPDGNGGEISNDLVEVFRPAVSDVLAATPFREALADARHFVVAPVTQRQHGEHAAADLDRSGAAVQDELQLLMVVAGIRPVRVQLEAVHEVVRSILEHEAAQQLGAGLGDYLRAHEREALVELADQPAVVGGRLPRAAAPRVIAQAEALDAARGAIDGERADGTAVLLVVSAGELHLAVLRRLATVHRTEAVPIDRQ